MSNHALRFKHYPEVLAHIVVRQSPLGGRGVFAAKSFDLGELIELCPLLLLDSLEWAASAVLADHVVRVRSPYAAVALPLGYGALYNHSDIPNATWRVDGDAATMVVRARRKIAQDEEILIHYGRLFFDSRGMTKRTPTA